MKRCAALLGALLAACATPLDEAEVAVDRVAARWLPPIVPGETPMAVLEAAFGAPTASFDAGRLRCWVIAMVEADAKVEVRADGTVPSPVVLGGGRERSARRAALLQRGDRRVVSAADLAARELWPTVREAEFHLVALDDGRGRIARHALVRVLP